MPENSAFQLPESPVALMGTVVLWIGFIVAAYAVAAGIVGNVQKRRGLVDSSVSALYGFFALMMLASALMIYAFVSHDYTIKYVALYSDTSMPLAYKITAFWGGLDGSMLFWIATLATFAAIAVRMNHVRHREMIGYVVATIMATQVFFLAVAIYSKNPFATFITDVPVDGKGLNPLLQNYWMVIHPPAQYIGFVAATIPFAFGVGALASGRLDDRWLGSVRSWMLLCWFFLSLGLILGGRWAYEELGWGGYWGWDPVENAALLPWFTSAAFLHSLIIQEQRGMLKVWNLVLVVMTFFLTIFATFMTRSGIVQSVHSFGKDNELALFFIIFMVILMVMSFGLLIFRLPRLRAANSFESLMSREFAFLLNNWVLLTCSAFVLFATMFPTISEAINGDRVTVGPEFYNKWMTPFGLVLLFLSGIAPLLAYRRTTAYRLYRQLAVPVGAALLTIALLALLMPRTRVRTPILLDELLLPISLINFGLVAFVVVSVGQEFWKGLRVRMRQSKSDPITALLGLIVVKRRRYGGYIVHLGVAVMFLGFAGKAYNVQDDFTVSKEGETFELRGYHFQFQGLVTRTDDNKRATMATVGLFSDAAMKDEIAVLTPERRKYTKSSQPTSEVSISQHLDEDIYLVLTGFDDRSVNFRVYVNPLVSWVWLGFGILILGTAICLLPQGLVENLRPSSGKRRRRGAESAVALLVAGGISLAAASLVHAQASPAGAGERQAQPPSILDDEPEHGAKRGRSEEGVGYSHECRPENGVARDLMKEIVCMCPNCGRESIYECKCGYAAEERCKVIKLLAGRDLASAEARQRAHDEVLGLFLDQYGQKVLATPRSKLSWAVPVVIAVVGLILLVFIARVWTRRGRESVDDADDGSSATSEEDEDYAEMLDDELREIE